MLGSGIYSVSVYSKAGSAAGGVCWAYVNSEGSSVEWSISDVWCVVSGIYGCSVSEWVYSDVVWYWTGYAIAGLIYVVNEVVMGSGVCSYN